MEFEFRKDFITEKATVKLSMGHEAFATWLEQEGQSVDWVNDLLEKTYKIQSRNAGELKLVGGEFSLLLNHDEVEVVNHSILNDVDDSELESDFSFYELETRAYCGLEDFINFMESWLEFISGR
ncbi:MAG: YacL family protein [Psychromonas sp.]